MGRFGRPDWTLFQASPDTSQHSTGAYYVDPRMHAQIGLSTALTNKLRFSPSISYQRIMKGSQATLVVHGMVDYLYNEAKNTVLLGGLGYRSGAGVGDAIQVMVGAYIKNIKVMLGYDVNVSSLSVASGNQGEWSFLHNTSARFTSGQIRIQSSFVQDFNYEVESNSIPRFYFGCWWKNSCPAFGWDPHSDDDRDSRE